MQKAQGFVENGNLTVTVGGVSAAQKVQGSYPQATVTVYNAGTVVLASIFSDNGITPKANPFTAATNSYFFFYAANSRYDVTFSGGGLSAPLTFGDVLLADPFGTSGVVLSFNGRVGAVVPVATDYPGPGRVLMQHNATGTWTVYKPDNSVLSTIGSTTQGLQEAITYAYTNGYNLTVLGGGVIFTQPAGPTHDYSRITCTTPIAFPPCWVNTYLFLGVNLLYDVAGGANAGLDFITFNSADMYSLNMRATQIIYPGTAAAVRFLPVVNQGESFAGTVSSNIQLGTIAVVDSVTLAPKSTAGTGVRVSTPHLGLGLTFGDGLFQGSSLTGNEINGGLVGLQIDDPGAGNSFNGCHVAFPFIHGQGTASVKVGTSAASAGLIYGNTYDFGLTPDAAGDALHIWGGSHFSSTQPAGDTYRVSILSGVNGVVFQSSANHNVVIVAAISISSAWYVNNATAQTNRVIDANPYTLASPATPASLTAFQNLHLKEELLSWFGGTVTLVEVSPDNSTWITIGAATNGNTWLKPGWYARWTYTVAPTLREMY